ncbi:MAG: FHA domain-containing protein [Ardenticatenaceae bacterium]
MSTNFILHFLQSGKRFSVKDEVTAGASSGCDLKLADYFEGSIKTISRQHFKISQSGEGLRLIDLNSTNGTQVNGEKLSPHTAKFLRHGDIVRLARNDKLGFEILIEEDEHGTEVVDGTARLTQTEEIEEGISFDEGNSLFRVDGKLIPPTHLTEFEHSLLKYLYDNYERTCSHYDIAKNVWGGWVGKDPIIKMVSKLRAKLNRMSSDAGKRYIRTIRGYDQGYLLTGKK